MIWSTFVVVTWHSSINPLCQQVRTEVSRLAGDIAIAGHVAISWRGGLDILIPGCCCSFLSLFILFSCLVNINVDDETYHCIWYCFQPFGQEVWMLICWDQDPGQWRPLWISQQGQWWQEWQTCRQLGQCHPVMAIISIFLVSGERTC